VLGKASAKITKTKLNIPIALTISVIPDIDILVPFLQHRGPVHSIVTLFMFFIPIFAIYRKKVIPYFLALIQHSLIGDYITGGGIQLLWPITTQYYGMGIGIKSQTNITIEWTMFLASIIMMLKTKDMAIFFQPHNSSLILSIPTFTVLLPTFLAFPLEVPPILILPHIVYLILLLTSILIDVRKILTNSACKPYTKIRTINDT
jgi:membrane-bound metal-dependent hydrolase YbcI (DUF457 family)